jgi:hypothetical protein
VSRITYPLFGDVDPRVSQYWEVTVTFAGRPVTIDLNIDDADIAKAQVQRVSELAEDLASLDRIARAALLRVSMTAATRSLSRCTERPRAQSWLRHQ